MAKFEFVEQGNHINVRTKNAFLGTLRKTLDEKYLIETLGSWDQHLTKEVNYSEKFETQEQAAKVLHAIYGGISENPVPLDVREYLSRQDRELGDEYQRLKNRLISVRREIEAIRKISKTHKIEGLGGAVPEQGEALGKLDEFLREHNDHLYEAFGKDFARTLRTLVKRTIESYDSQAADDL